MIKTDILPLVQQSWKKAFANVVTNLIAIRARGWDPYNFMLLLNPVICATMTKDMLKWERECGLFPMETKGFLHHLSYFESNGKISLMAIREEDLALSNINFDGGAIAQHVASHIMSEIDRQHARARNQLKKEEGTTLREQILAIAKKMTAGKLVIEGRSHHLDKNVLEHVRKRRREQDLKKVEKKRKLDLEFIQNCYIADKVLKKYEGIDVKDWNRKDEILAVLKTLKRDGDPAMPTKQCYVEEHYNEWKFCCRKQIEVDEIVNNLFEEWKKQNKTQDDEE